MLYTPPLLRDTPPKLKKKKNENPILPLLYKFKIFIPNIVHQLPCHHRFGCHSSQKKPHNYFDNFQIRANK